MKLIRFALLTFTILSLFVPKFALALTPEQRSEIERRPYYDKTDCAAGSVGVSTTTNTTTTGTTAEQGQTYWLGDSLSVGLKGAGLEAKLNQAGFTPAQINANGGRAISSPGIRGGGGSFRSGLQAVNDDRDFITASKNIVIALGTNLETDFSRQQTDLIAKIKSINPNIKIFWMDISAVGNGSNYNKDLAQGTNVTIYSQATTLGYNPLSQFKFVWGEDQDPNALASKSLPDPKNLLSTSDGIHFGPDGYTKLADDLTQKLGSGSITSNNNNAFDICGTCSVSPANGSSSLVGNNNAEKSFTYLVGHGFSAIQAAGVIGNMVGESGVNPRRVEGTTTPSGDSDTPDARGFGIVQYTPGTKIVPYAESKGLSPGDLGLQLDFLVTQLNGGGPNVSSEKAAGDALKATTTIEDATRVFLFQYERPLESLREATLRNTRLPAAIQALTDFGSLSGGGTVTTGGSAPGCQTATATTGTITVDPAIENATKEELVEMILANPNIIIQPEPGADVVGDLRNVAQKDLLRAIAIIGKSFGKPVTLRLIRTGQDDCGDFANGATNYGSFTSSHGYGLAADFDGDSSNATIVELYKWLYTNRSVLRIGELEHSPLVDGAKNIKFGGDYVYPDAIQADHADHIHIGIKGVGTKSANCSAKPGGEKIE